MHNKKQTSKQEKESDRIKKSTEIFALCWR